MLMGLVGVNMYSAWSSEASWNVSERFSVYTTVVFLDSKREGELLLFRVCETRT